MIPARSFGWKPDRPDPRDRKVSAARIGYAPPGPVSLLPYRARRWYQDGVSSCVGHSLARNVHVSLLRQGFHDAPEPSPMFIYLNARLQEWAGEDVTKVPPLEDGGCYPRLAMKALQQVGFCKEEDWPFHPSNRTVYPPRKIYKRAYDQRLLEYERIDSTDEERIEDIRASLHNGWPVGIALLVDRPFTEHQGAEPIEEVDITRPVGGHMLSLLAHDGAGNSIVDNWWTDWGTSTGLGYLSDRLVCSAAVGDIYRVKAARMFTQ